MNKKLQVFISSTFVDMQEERQAAVQVILQANHIRAGMELFTAGDGSQMDTIRRWIDDSDVYVLILGGRYGTVEPRTGKSYTHLEWDYAGEQKKPRLAFIARDSWNDEKVQKAGSDWKKFAEQDHPDLLKKFRAEFNERMCSFFCNLNELKLAVFQALAEVGRNESLVGWVRGNEAVNPKPLLEDVARLQSENRTLSDRIRLLEGQQVRNSTGDFWEIVTRLDEY